MKFGMQFTKDDLNVILKGLDNLDTYEANEIHSRISGLIRNAEHRVETDDGVYKTLPVDKIIKIVSVSGDRMHSELEEIGKEECPDCNGTGKEVEWV